MMRNLLFVTLETLTTRDPIGAMSSDELNRAMAVGIFITMFTMIMIPVVVVLIWFVWGQILTRGRLLRDIEKWFKS
jgi:hypothetical protein